MKNIAGQRVQSILLFLIFQNMNIFLSFFASFVFLDI